MIDSSLFFKKLQSVFSSTSVLTLETLLGRGYFPQELPPVFSTESFASVVTASGVKLPQEFTQKKSIWCSYVSYSLARPGALRRRLAILNPLAYYRLSAEIVKSQKSLFRLASPKVVCLSHPKIQKTGARAISTFSPLSDLPAARARSRVGKWFLLKTDIARFYPSIYTHTLDWAITGREKARKAFKAVDRLGTRIDALVQASQAGQTRGIPIGPDSSLLLAHVLLAPVDKALKKRVPLNGFRFLDDYELVFETRSQAEEALATLEEALAAYALELNSLKTRIEELPVELESPAIVELRIKPLRLAKGSIRSDLISFFNAAFEYSKRHPDSPILRFAVGRLNRLSSVDEDRRLIQDLVLQCATVEPGVWRTALPLLQRLHKDRTLAKDGIAAVIEHTIRRQAPRSHSSEVAWSIWVALVLEIELSAKATKAIVKMHDDVCSLLVLHAAKVGIATLDAGCMNQLTARARPEELNGEHWLFTYESTTKNWVNPSDKASFFNQHPHFKFLKNEGVAFYDMGKLAEAKAVPDEDEIADEDDDFDYGDFLFHDEDDEDLSELLEGYA